MSFVYKRYFAINKRMLFFKRTMYLETFYIPVVETKPHGVKSGSTYSKVPSFDQRSKL